MKDLLNYKQIGVGEPAIVFVHGLLGYWRNFYTISKAFKEDHTCVLYDQRGHGVSYHKKPYKVEELAQDLKELIVFLKLKPVILVGHSLGGFVCSYLAYKEPDLVKKLVVLDSSPWPKKGVADEIQQILNSLPDSFKDRQTASDFFTQRVKDKVFSKQLSYFLMASLEKNSHSPIRFLFDKKGLLEVPSYVRGLDHPRFLKALKIPILFLRGENSMHFSKSDLQKTVKLNPLIQAIEITNSGHWLHAEQTVACIKELKRFFSE